MKRFLWIVGVSLAACGGSAMVGQDAGSDSGPRTDAGSIDAQVIADAGSDAAMESDSGEPAVDAFVPIDAAPMACGSDEECAPAGFCRVTMDGGRACAAYSPEGALCGGFVPPWAVSRCAPDVDCVHIRLIPDAPGVCAIRVTVAELEADPSRYDGHYVAITPGYADASALRCTTLACSPAMPCCNNCTGNEELRDSADPGPAVDLYSSDGMQFTCMGNECTQECTQAQDASYNVTGTFDASENALLVDDFIAPGEV